MGYDPAAAEDAWAFGRALASPDVRAQLARCGYASGTVILVGDTQPEADEVRPLFRVWRDDSVPGGWTGQPVCAHIWRTMPDGEECMQCGERE
jgi:hypothetical protein